MSEQVKTPWGELGYIVYKRTYSRINEHTGASEEYPETINRVLDACNSQLNMNLSSEETEEYKAYMLGLKGSVAGRFLWQLGTSTVGKLGLASLQNCAAIVIDHPVKPFAWAFELLMLGSGVGYNIQREYVYKLPPVLEGNIKVSRLDKPDADFIVPDSREGWVKLLEQTLSAYFYTGKSFSYSTMLVRGKGTAIKGFGGIASGPEELCWGIDEISKVLSNRAGKQLRPIDCLDIMNIIGYVVVSGNVRRSAQIALGDCDDLQYLNAKRWDLGNIPNWRAMSNNSVVCNDYSLLPEAFWQGYMGNGEPYGLINLGLARKVGRLVDGDKYPDKKVAIFNPCVTGDTLVAVADGRNAVPIKDLVGSTYPVYAIENKKVVIKQSVKTWKTRENAEVWRLTLDDGSYLDATPDHLIMLRTGEYKALKDLNVNDSLMPFNSYVSNNRYRQIATNDGRDRRQYRMIAENNGLIVDAKTTAIHHADFNSKNDCIENLVAMSHEDHVELHRAHMMGSKNAVFRIRDKDKWKSLLSEAGSGMKNPNANKMSNLEIFDLTVQKTKEFGRLMTEKEYLSIPDVPQQFGPYRQKELGKIGDMLKQAALHCDLIKIEDIDLNARSIRHKYNHKVTSIEFLKYEDVYDMTVEDVHNFGVITSNKDDLFMESSGIFIHNCAEQGLESGETCCLAELFLPNITSKEELFKVAKMLYRICKHSLALPCHLEDTAKVVSKNMRMGIGVTGYLQATEEKREWLSDCYDMLRKFDKEYSKAHGWPKSIKLTTVKPSGTLSTLAGVTSGVHPAIYQYFIRRVRMASNHSLVQLCKDHGFHTEYQKNFDGTDDRNTVVVEFPCSYPEGTILAKDTSAVEQLKWVKKLQSDWSDNSVSCTVYYKKEELDEIKAWLKDNYNDGHKTLSFLLHNDHGFTQAPYEEISKEAYEALRMKVVPITGLEQVLEMNEDSWECSTGSCPIR